MFATGAANVAPQLKIEPHVFDEADSDSDVQSPIMLQDPKSSTSSLVFRSGQLTPGTSSTGSSASPDLVPPLSNAAKRRRQKPLSPELWESHKHEICRLYLDENKRLKDVMEIMARDKGFHASPKMYKTKLTQWKFFKNNRQSDVANILSLQKRRSAMGKDTIVQRNGKLIDVHGYMKRKGITAEDLNTSITTIPETQTDLPPTLDCRTPPPSPPLVLSRGMTPTDDQGVRELLHQWAVPRVHMYRNVERWFLNLIDDHRQSSAMESVRLLTESCYLFSLGQNKEAGELCRSGFELVHNVLEERAALSFFELVIMVLRYKNADVARELWKYLSKYAATCKDVNHPFRRALTALSDYSAKNSFEETAHVLRWTLQWPATRFGGRLDGRRFDYSVLHPWDLIPVNCDYHRYYIYLHLWDSDDIPTATVPGLTEFSDAGYLRADLLLAYGTMEEWYNEKIPRLAHIMIENDRSTGSNCIYLQWVCLYAIAKFHKANSARLQDDLRRDELKLAIYYLQMAADLQGRHWPPGRNYHETLATLEEWSMEAGDKLTADYAQSKRDETPGHAVEDVS
ncbi:hypothetical protein Micbo1qcDRAFT_13961 [Microdochium bolleyi]|uniref:Clr5 domain-containing protein n=1 Tax=Microdochium bolleyi TaxID=196109 RepID=A0A136IVY5_9PEZI|nr:hypothetical protein Micbo1qcDRAFT_13961 [Microdochium bolleyi]